MMLRLNHAAVYTSIMNCDCNFYQRGEKEKKTLFASFVKYSFLTGKNTKYVILIV